MDLIACGHSHEAFVKQVKGTWFVNPGSVGRPEGGDWRASYALLDFTGGDLTVEHRRVEYDVDRVVRAIRAAGLPDSFADVLRQGRSIDQLQGSGPPASRRHRRSLATAADSVLDAVLAFARDCNYEPEHTHQVTELALDDLRSAPESSRPGTSGAIVAAIRRPAARHRLDRRAAGASQDLAAADSCGYQTALRPSGAPDRWVDRPLPSQGRYRMTGTSISTALSPEDQHRVRVLAGILRVADGLDCTHANVIRRVTCKVSSREITIVCEASGPADDEIAAAEEKADLLESVFDRRCVVKVLVKTYERYDDRRLRMKARLLRGFRRSWPSSTSARTPSGWWSPSLCRTAGSRSWRGCNEPFAWGRIRSGPASFARETMRSAISILRDYRHVLNTYGAGRTRAVATSAVREAANADTFVDRILMATGIEVSVISVAEEGRLTVSAVRRAVGEKLLQEGDALVVEVGGGSTIMNLLHDGEIAASQSLPTGSVRMQEMLSTSTETAGQATRLIKRQISSAISTLQRHLAAQERSGLYGGRRRCPLGGRPGGQARRGDESAHGIP